MAQAMRLLQIRSSLEFMEDEIMLALLRRSRHPLNKRIYTPGGVDIPGFGGSFLEKYLLEREKTDNSMGRYTDRREHSFFPMEGDVVPVLRGQAQALDPIRTNRNADILETYVRELPTFCQPEDDRSRLGTAAERDIDVLHEISQRVHLGEFVAEAKWRDDVAILFPLVHAHDVTRLTEALRDRSVEQKVSDRVRTKAAGYKLNPDAIVDFYVNHIIPLTIDVEVEYLQRNKGRVAVDPAEAGVLFEKRVELGVARLLKAHPYASRSLVEDVAVEAIKSDDAVIRGNITLDEHEKYNGMLMQVLKRDEVRGKLESFSRRS